MAEGLARHRVTLGADNGYDAREFTAEQRRMDVTPHIAQNDTNRWSAIDERTTRHLRYQDSQKKRKRIEETFGWMKCIGLLRKLRDRGLERVGEMTKVAVCDVKHIQPNVSQTTVSMLATTPKPRVIKLEILPEGKKTIASGKTKHETVRTS